MLMLLLIIVTPLAAAPRSVTFSAPLKISGVAESCASAGGTDGFVSLGSSRDDGRHVLGPCHTDSVLKHTANAGKTWETLQFAPSECGSGRTDRSKACLDSLGTQWQWSLVPFPATAVGLAYHTWGGIDVRSTERTQRSYTGANITGVFAIDAAGQLQRDQVARRVTIEGLPHDVNMSFPSTGMSPGLPVFYGGPIRRQDGAWVATLGVYWAGQPLSPSPDGPILKMSVIAIVSADTFAWKFLSVVANASNAANASVFGPNENDIAMLSDGKTLLCVLRMDGDGPCDSGSHKANGGTGGDYRYYASSISTNGGISWSHPRPIAGAGCARPRLLSLGPGKPLLLSGGRLCVENTTDLSLWVNEDGMGGYGQSGSNGPAFVKHSLSFWHNHLWNGGNRSANLFRPSWINNSADWETLAYTSIMPAGPDSAYIVYQKYSAPKWGSTSASYMMKVVVNNLLHSRPAPKYTAAPVPAQAPAATVRAKSDDDVAPTTTRPHVSAGYGCVMAAENTTEFTDYRWDLLDSVHFHDAVGLNADGTTFYTNGNGSHSHHGICDYPDGPHFTAVRAQARAAGVQLWLSTGNSGFGSFGPASDEEMYHFLSDKTIRSRAIKSSLDAVEAGGLDGLSLDIEGNWRFNHTIRAPHSEFVRDLAAAGQQRTPKIKLRYPIFWDIYKDAAVDLVALTSVTEATVLMTYDYHWGGDGRAGPNAPLTNCKINCSGEAAGANVERTIQLAHSLSQGSNITNPKFFLGIAWCKCCPSCCSDPSGAHSELCVRCAPTILRPTTYLPYTALILPQMALNIPQTGRKSMV